jgi:hypothetical protein
MKPFENFVGGRRSLCMILSMLYQSQSFSLSPPKVQYKHSILLKNKASFRVKWSHLKILGGGPRSLCLILLAISISILLSPPPKVQFKHLTTFTYFVWAAGLIPYLNWLKYSAVRKETEIFTVLFLTLIHASKLTIVC